jgi:hypothetical protein
MEKDKRAKENRQLLMGVWLVVVTGVIFLICGLVQTSREESNRALLGFGIFFLVVALGFNAFRLKMRQIPMPGEITGIKLDE